MRVGVNQLRLNQLRLPARLATALALALLAAPARARTAAPSSAVVCPAAGLQNAKVAKVDSRLDLTLQDGRSLHLAGLDPVQPTPDAPDFPDRAKAALAAAVGSGISFLPLAASPDRWGRIPAFVFVAQPAPKAPEGLAEFLLAQGFARYMPVPEAHSCAAAFRAAEEKARRTGQGLWRDPYYAILEATNRASFADMAATNVIVEGRLVAVTANHYRTSLAFAPSRDHGFAVTILRRNVTIFERAGLNFRALIGRTLRVRGLLDLRFGPEIEINSADDIEVVTESQNEGDVAKRSETGLAPPPAK
jgi:endonuclease YncB( thermonuclease family)